MITNEQEYDAAILEYELLYNRYDELTDKEKKRLNQIESDLDMYDSLKLSKN